MWECKCQELHIYTVHQVLLAVNDSKFPAYCAIKIYAQDSFFALWTENLPDGCFSYDQIISCQCFDDSTVHSL